MRESVTRGMRQIDSEEETMLSMGSGNRFLGLNRALESTLRQRLLPHLRLGAALSELSSTAELVLNSFFGTIEIPNECLQFGLLAIGRPRLWKSSNRTLTSREMNEIPLSRSSVDPALAPQTLFSETKDDYRLRLGSPREPQLETTAQHDSIRGEIATTDPIRTGTPGRSCCEDELERAIENQEFVLHYQPQVNFGNIVGAEALIRWNHPTRGLLSPAEFIPFAEETGLILQLGNWVLEAVCAQLAAWSRRDVGAGITIAVNVSTRQIAQLDFVEAVRAAIERAGVNPENLEIELTESALLSNYEDAIAKMKALKSIGVRFSLDDFGTGYSSLSYLKRLPLDQVKIDISFVRDLLVDVSTGAIVQAIVSLGHAMGLAVIAEGVECEEQRKYLSAMGCHSYQGFLISRPLSIKDFERMLRGGYPFDSSNPKI